MNTCQHLRRQGDNYGTTCQDCGAKLEGYGYGDFFGSNLKGHEQCLHVWMKSNAQQEECLYCHMVQEKATT
ncbi:MAG: hypothetical protein ACJ8CB_29645, partial [Ktedonobacteraceae bacterium]